MHWYLPMNNRSTLKIDLKFKNHFFLIITIKVLITIISLIRTDEGSRVPNESKVENIKYCTIFLNISSLPQVLRYSFVDFDKILFSKDLLRPLLGSLAKGNLQKLAKMSISGITRPFTVIVEGNIGSGKTSFLNHFSSLDNITTLAEPVDLWRNCDGNNLLGLVYEDPKKWSFTFQSYVQLTMLKNHQHDTLKPVKLMERSIYSGRYCFVEKLIRDKTLSEPSAAVIDSWFKWIVENVYMPVDLIVYLRTSPEVTYDRILKRARPEEKPISFKYVEELHKIHEDWLYHKTLWVRPAPVLVLNADLDKLLIKSEYVKCEPYILNKLPMPISPEQRAF